MDFTKTVMQGRNQLYVVFRSAFQLELYILIHLTNLEALYEITQSLALAKRWQNFAKSLYLGESEMLLSLFFRDSLSLHYSNRYFDTLWLVLHFMHITFYSSVPHTLFYFNYS